MKNPKEIFGRLGNSLFQFSYIYAQMREGNIPDIYLQDPKYFDSYREDIRKLYAIKQDPIDMVAIHVRHGVNPINPDEPKYCENPFYVNLMNTTYYSDAMALFPNANFMVFSDDIEWCKKQLIFKHCKFSEGKTELEDMELMANCSGIIMANSSFSWWGAYLGGGKTIAPTAKNWYTDGIERTVCPQEWIRI